MNVFTVQTAIILFLLKNVLIVSYFGYLLNGLHVNLNVHVSECNAWIGFKLNCINMSLCALLLCCFIHVNDAMSPHRFYWWGKGQGDCGNSPKFSKDTNSQSDGCHRTYRWPHQPSSAGRTVCVELCFREMVSLTFNWSGITNQWNYSVFFF